jgi:hypothetical protein
MLAMVRALLFLILLTLKSVHTNTRLPYPIFYMFLTLKSPYYRRLGHPSLCSLHFLVSTKQVSCTPKQFNFNCPACPLGKSSRLTLKTTGHQTQAPLDLIFSDV